MTICITRGIVRGKALVMVENVGFNNVDEVIEHLMSRLPDTIASRSLVQIRIENKDKGLSRDYSRMVK